MSRARHQNPSGMLGSFIHIDSVMTALEAAKAQDIPIVDVYSPVPLENAIALVSPRRSPVRHTTFLGALLGGLGGLALGIGTSMIWNIVVGGKPVTNFVPFMVIAFEGMVLFGALFTFTGLLFFGGLPFLKFPSPAYRSEFSVDRFGVWLGGTDKQQQKARALLEDAGAVAVEPVAQNSERRTTR